MLLAIIALGVGAEASAPSEKQMVFDVARRAVEGFDGKDRSFVQTATWPDGFLIQRQRKGGPYKRHWSAVPFSGHGVLTEHRFARPNTVIRGNRASILVDYQFRLNFAERIVDGVDNPVECSVGTYRFDLLRRHGEWRVLNLTDSVRRPSRGCTA